MCDYSLHNVASRPAKVGDKLVTTQFYGTITRGFAANGEPGVAVCLVPGTEIAFEKEVKWRSSTFGLLVKRRHVDAKVARFRQINKDEPRVHHDALEFPTGETVLVANSKRGPTGNRSAASGAAQDAGRGRGSNASCLRRLKAASLQRNPRRPLIAA